MAGHFFISYSRADGEQIALTLGDQLAKGPPPIGVWLDRRRLQPGIDWDKQLVEALRACDGLLFVMTEDSVSDESECKKEWTRALKYKKPIVPLLFDKSLSENNLLICPAFYSKSDRQTSTGSPRWWPERLDLALPPSRGPAGQRVVDDHSCGERRFFSGG